jgi:hypothetical protein
MADKCSFTIFKTYFGKEMTREIVKQLGKDEEMKCEFTVWREVSGKKITLKDSLTLCKNGVSDKSKFKPKNGEEYTGFYKLDSNFKLEIVKTP